MSNTVVAAKDSKQPNSSMLREQIIPRVVADIRETMRGTAQTGMANMCDVFDTTVQSTNKKLTGQAWTPGGAEYVKNEARLEAEGMLDVILDSTTKGARDHFAQLDRELTRVPEPSNGFAAMAVWQKLDAMNASDRDHFLSRTDDPAIVSAVFHAPSVFSLGHDDARKRMLTNYNRAHRPEPFALANDCRSFIDAVEGFADTLKRELRRALR
jgi:hypothetical protein